MVGSNSSNIIHIFKCVFIEVETWCVELKGYDKYVGQPTTLSH